MSDECLRHLAANSGKYSEVRVFDPKTLKEENVLTGQAMRLLMSMCHHANVERTCFVGRETFMEETGLDGRSIETVQRRLEIATFIKYLGKRSYKGSLPVNNYLINFPDLPPLEEVLTEKEIKKKARSLGASRSVLATDLSDASNDALLSVSQTALRSALSVRHKQKQVTEIVNGSHLQQESSHGCYESEPSEEERLEFFDFIDALVDPF